MAKAVLPLILSPSILSANFGNLASDVNKIEEGGAQWLHVDVMDGHFVPNLSMGASTVKCLRPSTSLFMDVHLMVSHPAKWVQQFAEAGTSQYTFHYEAVNHSVDECIKLAYTIRQNGMLAGLAVKPGTPIEDVFPALDSQLFSILLVMTVEPGFGGQSFMADMMKKVQACRKRYPMMNIEVDGGLNEKTTKIAIENGANVIVTGSTIFNSANPTLMTQTLLQVMTSNAIQQPQQ